MSYSMSDLLQLVVYEGASDLHIRVGTPPTIRVPYSRQCFVWNWPALPVIPWQSTRVFRSMRMLMDR